MSPAAVHYFVDLWSVPPGPPVLPPLVLMDLAAKRGIQHHVRGLEDPQAFTAMAQRPGWRFLFRCTGDRGGGLTEKVQCGYFGIKIHQIILVFQKILPIVSRGLLVLLNIGRYFLPQKVKNIYGTKNYHENLVLCKSFCALCGFCLF